MGNCPVRIVRKQFRRIRFEIFHGFLRFVHRNPLPDLRAKGVSITFLFEQLCHVAHGKSRAGRWQSATRVSGLKIKVILDFEREN